MRQLLGGDIAVEYAVSLAIRDDAATIGDIRLGQCRVHNDIAAGAW
jgi:hypothetical protein